MHDTAKRITLDLLNHDMDVVGHDCPREKPIALAVKESERVLDETRNFGTSQDARATSSIDQPIKPLEAILVGRSGRENGVVDAARKTVGQTKRDGLHDSATVEMRQISSLVPAPVRARGPRSR